jgi:putative glucoamylase
VTRITLPSLASCLAAACVAASVAAPPAQAAPAPAAGGLSWQQRAALAGIARDTWAFFADDVDPTTHLPLDNLGPGTARGRYTSAANIGVYLWAVVSAGDLHLISRERERSLAAATLRSVAGTTTGAVILDPGNPVDCATRPTPAQDNCSFLSAVDNGWYVSGLVIARQALPELRALVDRLLRPVDFSIFYDDRPQTDCNTNPAVPGNQPTGQMYGGFYVDQGPAGYHNGALYSDPRIAMYLGMGLRQMPGDVWWRTWRTLPPMRCATDPDFSWQGQWPVGGSWTTVHDPVSGRDFPVWEGHYTYPGTSLNFLPTWAGGMFEALMPNLVVPETTWGRRGLGAADVLTAQVQMRYATQTLHFPVWGLSPASTADDTGGYGIFGADGQAFPAGQRLAQCADCGTETAVTPHASFLALDVLPRQAYANIQRLRTLYPDIYTHRGGFYDAVNPTTGSVGHRRLVLDQAMIMAALDNALNGGALRRYFAADPLSWAAHRVLAVETMSITAAGAG